MVECIYGTKNTFTIIIFNAEYFRRSFGNNKNPIQERQKNKETDGKIVQFAVNCM